MYKRKYSHSKNKVQTLSFLRFMCLNISYGSLLLWSIHVYVHTMPRRKGIRRDHTEAIVIRPFPNYLKSIILQGVRLFSTGKHSRKRSQVCISQKMYTPWCDCATVQTRLKKNCLAVTHRTTFGKKQTKHISTNISYQQSLWWRGDDFGSFCSQT